MFDDYLESGRHDPDTFAELDADDLEEWDSLKDLLSDLADREREPVDTNTFDIPPLLGDGDGITRWMLRISQVRRLSNITRLRQGLPNAPWCIAVRIIAIDHDAIRVGVTTTRRVSHDQLRAYIEQLLEQSNDQTIEIEPVVHQAIGERWLTIDEVAREVSVTPGDVEHWIEAGLVVTRRVDTAHGAEWRVRLRSAATRQSVGV